MAVKMKKLRGGRGGGMFGFLSLNVAVKMKKLCVWRGGGADV